MREEKTQLGTMLGAQPNANVGTPGKATEVAKPDQLEGGEGSPAKASVAGAGKPAPKGTPAAAGLSVLTKKKAATADNARTTIGLGEEIDVTATSFGTWKVDGKELPDKGRMLTRQGFREPGWVGDKLGDHVIEHTPDEANAKPSTVTIKVIAPTGVKFKKIGDLPMAGPGFAGVGMRTKVTVLPTEVSFAALEWKELPSGAAKSDYFAEYEKQAKGNSLDHKPAEAGVPMGESNDGIVDAAFSRDKPKLKHADGSMRWWGGNYSWAIPNAYTFRGEPPVTFATSQQAFSIADDGAMSVTKDGEKATARPGGQMDGEIEKYATVPDAISMLSQMGTGCIATAMNYISNPKADPASVKNIIEGLKASKIFLAITLNCNDKYSWVDPDTAEVKATGFSGGKPAKPTKGNMFHTGQSRKFLVAIGEVFDLDKLDPKQEISVEANISGWKNHVLSFKTRYPYTAFQAPLEGTSRYTVNTKIQIGSGED